MTDAVKEVAIVTTSDLLAKERALEASSCGIVLADALAVDMPLVYVNKAFERITGYKKKEILGRNCRFLQGDELDQPSLKKVRETLEKKTSCEVVVRNYRKDGTPFWNELKLAPVFSDAKKLTHYIGIQTDVTKRVEAEVQLGIYQDHLEDLVNQKTDAVKAKNAALKELLSQIEVEKQEIQTRVLANLDNLVLPLLEKMNQKLAGRERHYLSVLQNNLQKLTEGFGASLSRKLFRLSPREIEICNFIKHGMSTKDIAECLDVSIKTVENQRNSVRKKLGISKEQINLAAFLQTL